jgi:hypothetical protein
VFFGTVLFRTLLAEGWRWESGEVARGQPKSADGSRPLPIPARSDSFRLAGVRKLRHVPTYEEMGMGRDVTRADLLAGVEKVTPLIKEHADSGERERHLMDPVVEALRAQGFIAYSSLGTSAACRWIPSPSITSWKRFPGSTARLGGACLTTVRYRSRRPSCTTMPRMRFSRRTLTPSCPERSSLPAGLSPPREVTPFPDAGYMQAAAGTPRGTWRVQRL